MDRIKLKGEAKYSDGLTIANAGITLSPSELKAQLKPDISKIKNGDKVWVEYEISTIYDSSNFEGKDYSGTDNYVYKEEIVAHFPSEPEKKKAELPENLNLSNSCKDVICALNALIDVVREIKEKGVPFADRYGLEINGKIIPLSKLPHDINTLMGVVKEKP